MDKATYHGNQLPSNYGIFFTIRSATIFKLFEILEIVKKVVGGMTFAFFGNRSRTDDLVQQTFNMEEPIFAQDLNIQKTVKYGTIVYLLAAIITIPSGICSSSYQLPPFKTPLVAAQPSHKLFNIFWSINIPQPKPLADDEDQNKPSPNEDPEEPPFHKHIMRASQDYEVDSALIRAIIMAESSNNPRALSRKGAQGLMQLMPTTAKSLGVDDAYDPAMNIDGGVRYFKQLLDRFNGDVKLALAAYNAGSRYVRKYGGVPPFKATRIYIKKVLKYRRLYREQTVSTQSHPTPRHMQPSHNPASGIGSTL
jgi:hypothetical protein